METNSLVLHTIKLFILGYSTYNIAAFSYLVKRYNLNLHSDTIFLNPLVNLIAFGFWIYIDYLIIKQYGFGVFFGFCVIGGVFQYFVMKYFSGAGVYYSVWIFLTLGSAFYFIALINIPLNEAFTFGFCLYSLYSLLAYKYLRHSQINIITINYDKKYGKNWRDTDSLVIEFSSEVSKWSIGSIFSNTKFYTFILVLFVGLLIGGLFLYNFVSVLTVFVIVFLSNFWIGILLKGIGIQYSIYISLLLGMILMIL